MIFEKESLSCPHFSILYSLKRRHPVTACPERVEGYAPPSREWRIYILFLSFSTGEIFLSLLIYLVIQSFIQSNQSFRYFREKNFRGRKGRKSSCPILSFYRWQLRWKEVVEFNQNCGIHCGRRPSMASPFYRVWCFWVGPVRGCGYMVRVCGWRRSCPCSSNVFVRIGFLANASKFLL